MIRQNLIIYLRCFFIKDTKWVIRSIDFKARQHTGQKLKAKRKPMIYNILSGKRRLGNTKKQQKKTKQSKTKIKNKNKKKRRALNIGDSEG